MNIQAVEESKNDPLLLVNEQLGTDFSWMLSELGTAQHQVTDDDDEDEDDDDKNARSNNNKRPRLSSVMHDAPSSNKRIKQHQQQPVVYRRVRCKARGMSESHNSDTAYFEIPVNAPHGLLLCCSHPQCQVSNRKFRFCKECGVPVAKRNFIRRHGHGLVTSTKALKENVDNARIKFVEQTGCLPVGSTFAPPPPTTTDVSSAELHCRAISPSSSSSGEGTASYASLGELLPEAPHHQALPRSSFVANNNTTPDYYSSTLTMHQQQELSEEEKNWLSLLRSRPVIDDTASMMTWVGQVLDHANVASGAEKAIMVPVSDDDLEKSLDLFLLGDDINQCQSV